MEQNLISNQIQLLLLEDLPSIDDCKNYWLIKQNHENQIFDATCKGDNKLTLFDVEIKSKV